MNAQEKFSSRRRVHSLGRLSDQAAKVVILSTPNEATETSSIALRPSASTMVNTLQQIKDNGITDIDIAAPADEAFEDLNEFFDALAANTSLESVKLTKDFIGDLRHDTRHKLLISLGKVPTLKEVYLGDGLLLVKDINTMVSDAKSLRSLTLENLVLQGVSEHFDAFETTLYGHPSLKEFEIVECTPASDEASLEKLDRAGKKFSSATGSIDNPVQNAPSAVTA